MKLEFPRPVIPSDFINLQIGLETQPAPVVVDQAAEHGEHLAQLELDGVGELELVHGLQRHGLPATTASSALDAAWPDEDVCCFLTNAASRDQSGQRR